MELEAGDLKRDHTIYKPALVSAEGESTYTSSNLENTQGAKKWEVEKSTKKYHNTATWSVPKVQVRSCGEPNPVLILGARKT
ncbi:hypothetical protein PGT21_030709 [Puccinia graminis f. sp. tritici]|uniref:Uncharacterized protein n=1 Tax=Puccinia graminis f. sp. tritici TaxID=56615 RepID=A0A5B0QJ95_PUCGR|nr:hypothetical protein PGT21_030709 [Puccinia graminis f. sp. tritici]